MNLDASVQLALIGAATTLLTLVLRGLGGIVSKVATELIGAIREWIASKERDTKTTVETTLRMEAALNRLVSETEINSKVLATLGRETQKNTTALTDLATTITGDLRPRMTNPPGKKPDDQEEDPG